MYDLRDECDGFPNELKSFVVVNHWGTIITKDIIEGAEKGIPLTPDDYNYLGYEMTLEQFMDNSQNMAQTM